MGVVTIGTQQDFEEKVLKSEQPVLVDFWAPWCGPCKMVSPVVDEIAEESNHIKVGKINVDEEGELARDFKVMSIPTLMVFKDGKQYNSTVGVQSKQNILKLLD